jgi:CHASE2 domain-containing sensor protein
VVWAPIGEPLVLASLAGIGSAAFCAALRAARARSSVRVGRIVAVASANGLGSFSVALVAAQWLPEYPYAILGGVMFAGWMYDWSTDDARERLESRLWTLIDEWLEFRRDRRKGGRE